MAQAGRQSIINYPVMKSRSSHRSHDCDHGICSVAGKGIVKSVDGGANWHVASNPQPSTSVRTLAIDPLNAATIFAGTSNGVFKSLDGGTTWANSSAGLTNTFINDLAISPDNPNKLYLGTDKGVFKSIDGGINWTAASVGLPAKSQILALSLDPGASGLVYVGTSNGLYKSVNSGASWSQVNLHINRDPQSVDALAIDPLNPTRIFAGAIDGVYFSTDSGASWAQLNEGLKDLSISSMTIDPLNPSTVYVGSRGGGVFTRQSDVAQTTVYARVVDPNGQPFAGAQIYQNGRPVTDAAGNLQVTDSGGSLELTHLQAGDTLVALAPVYEQPTMRKGRAGAAYRIFSSNMGVGGDGTSNHLPWRTRSANSGW